MILVAQNLIVPVGGLAGRLTRRLFEEIVTKPQAPVSILLASNENHKLVKQWRNGLFPDEVLSSVTQRAIVARAHSLEENQAQNVVLAYGGQETRELQKRMEQLTPLVGRWVRPNGRIVIAHPAVVDADLDWPDGGKFLQFERVPFLVSAGLMVAVNRILSKLG